MPIDVIIHLAFALLGTASSKQDFLQNKFNRNLIF